MTSLADTFFGRCLGWLADSVCRHRRLYFIPQIILFVVCVVYTCLNLKFDPSRDNLVGSGKRYHQIFLKFKQEFPAQDDLVVVVESDDGEKNRQFVERLGAKLELETNIFTDVFYKGDLKMMGPKAMLFVPEKDLRDLQKTLGDFLPAIERFTQASNLNSLFSLINSQFLNAKREKNKENDALMNALPMMGRIIHQAADSLQRPGIPPSPGIEALFSAGDEAQQQIYITFAKGRIYLATTRAAKDELNDDAVIRLRQLVAATQAEVPGLNVGVTGEPVLEHDEMEQSQADATKASIVSLLVCALIFIYGYQETGRPLKATFALLIGLGYTMAFTTLVVGHLNLLTITFAPILIGLAIDFGVHLITRYEEELRHGHAEVVAMRTAIVFTGQGIFTGALTTAAAFAAMALTDFRGIQEMGIICGGGMMICLFPMLTFLPVMLFRGRQNAIDHVAPPHDDLAPPTSLRARIEGIWLNRPVTVVVITLIICALSFTQFHHISFDYNLLHMQSKGLPAVVTEQKLISSTSESVLFGAVVADSAEQAVELEKKLAQLPAVATNYSMANYLTEDQTEKLRLIGEIKAVIAPIRFASASPLPMLDPARETLGPHELAVGSPRNNGPEPVKLEELSSTLYSTAGYFGAASDETGKEGEKELSKQLMDLRKLVLELRVRMLTGDREAAARKLGVFQKALFDDVQRTFESFRNQDNSSRLQAKDLPAALSHRFIGVNGKFLIQVYPRSNIWERANQEEFIKQVRSVAPEVTGTPVQLYEYTTLLKDSYEQAAWYALAAIVVMVLFHFRSVSSIVLALLPVLVGSVWLGGFMGLFKVPFNPANIMTLPLVIGIGVTNGIHILNRFAEEKNPNILSKSTGKAVFVSGLTTISGFGSLMLAKHEGILSLGKVMSLGVAACMIAGLTFLPALLNLMLAARRRSGTEEP